MSKYSLLTTPVEGAHVAAAIKSFLQINAGDEATETLLVNVGAEILDCSQDQFLDLLESKELSLILAND